MITPETRTLLLACIYILEQCGPKPHCSLDSNGQPHPPDPQSDAITDLVAETRALLHKS